MFVFVRVCVCRSETKFSLKFKLDFLSNHLKKDVKSYEGNYQFFNLTAANISRRGVFNYDTVHYGANNWTCVV